MPEPLPPYDPSSLHRLDMPTRLPDPRNVVACPVHQIQHLSEYVCYRCAQGDTSPPEPTPPLDLAAIEAAHQHGPPGAIDEPFCGECYQVWPCEMSQVVARVRALETEVARLRQAALTVTADTDCTILSLRARLPDGTRSTCPLASPVRAAYAT